MNNGKAKITYRGWAGHFICASQCSFRLNTLIEFGDTRIIVSTVGGMRYDESSARILGKDASTMQEIGLGRFFETMAFHASRIGEFWDADVSRGEISFESKWAYNSPNDEWEANKGHIVVVGEIARRLEAGEKFVPEREK